MSSSLHCLAQKLTCGEQSRLHGFLREVLDLGDFAVREMKEMVKDDDGAVVLVEPQDGLVQVRGAFEIFEGFRWVRKALRKVVVERLMPVARVQVVDRLVDGNPVNPTEKATRTIVGREVLERFGEDLLADLTRVFRVSNHVQNGVEYWPLISVHQASERVEIAVSTSLDCVLIELFLVHEVQLRRQKVGYPMSKI